MNIYNLRDEQGNIIPIKCNDNGDGTYSLDLALFSSRQAGDKVVYFYISDKGEAIPLLCKDNLDGTYSIYTGN